MTVMSKAGEIAIVRANLAKSAKENDRRITALQSMHADEFARQKADLDRAIAERERVNTDNSFLKQELTEEVEKVKALKRSSKAGENVVTKGVSTDEGLNVTPRKLKSLTYRDGFDDDEIFSSPSRTIASRSSGGTPRGRSKRKRKTVDDSPVPPLQLSQITVDATAHLTGRSVSEALLQRIGREDGKFEVSGERAAGGRMHPDNFSSYKAWSIIGKIKTSLAVWRPLRSTFYLRIPKFPLPPYCWTDLALTAPRRASRSFRYTSVMASSPSGSTV